MKFKVLVVFLFFQITIVKAQDISPQLDKYLNNALENMPIPNVEVLVIKGNEEIYTKSIGDQAGQNNSYYLGSVSKSLTAFATLRLVDQGKLALKTSVNEILPNILFSQYGDKITIKNLLNHTSGISKKDGFITLPSLTELKSESIAIDIHFEPGKSQEYSNLNYSILGLVLEAVSGKSFGELIQEEVFVPLNMENSFALPQNQAEEKVVDQFQYWFGQPVESNQVNYAETVIPAGFISSSAADMANYLKVNLSGGKKGDRVIISGEMLKEMHTTWNGGEFGSAMGWKQGQINGQSFLQHLGSTGTSYSGIFIIPESQIGFVVLTNTNSLSFSEDLILGILQICTGNEPENPSRKEFYFRVLMGILILYFVGYFIFKMFKLLKHPPKEKRKKVISNLIIQAVILISFLFFFPKFGQLPFFSFYSMQPDIGTAVLVSLIVPIILNLVKLNVFKNFKPRRYYKFSDSGSNN